MRGLWSTWSTENISRKISLLDTTFMESIWLSVALGSFSTQAQPARSDPNHGSFLPSPSDETSLLARTEHEYPTKHPTARQVDDAPIDSFSPSPATPISSSTARPIDPILLNSDPTSDSPARPPTAGARDSDLLRRGKMGAWMSRVWFLMFPAQEYKLVVVGLDNAGKTTTLYKLHLGEAVTAAPTIGSNVEEVVFKNLRFEVSSAPPSILLYAGFAVLHPVGPGLR